jgi:hypothetical protein
MINFRTIPVGHLVFIRTPTEFLKGRVVRRGLTLHTYTVKVIGLDGYYYTTLHRRRVKPIVRMYATLHK